MTRRLPPEVMTVGVFRDEAPQRVLEMVNAAGLHGVQLHGHETPAEGKWVRQRVQFLIQAFSAGVELGGVSVYLSEIAAPGQKGFYVAWQSASQQVAVMFAARSSGEWKGSRSPAICSRMKRSNGLSELNASMR